MDGPPKMEIWNVQESDYLSAQFNPRKLPEKLKAVWTKHAVPGMSHQVLLYSHTENHEFPLELLWAVRTDDDKKQLDHARKFLMSLLYPWRGHTSPPRVVLVWPNIVDMTVIVTDMDSGHEFFDEDLNTTWWVCKLTVQEIRDGRIWGDDIYRNGTLRGTGYVAGG